MWLASVLLKDLRLIATREALSLADEIHELLNSLEEANYGSKIKRANENYTIWKLKEGNDIEKDRYYMELLARLQAANDGMLKRKALLLRRAKALVKRAENKAFWQQAAAERQARSPPTPPRTPTPPTASPPPPPVAANRIFRPWQ
jgi:hypothetical protein